MATESELLPPASALSAWTATETLSWAAERFHPRLVFASSFGAEDVVVIDLLARTCPGVRIATLDTGRLPEETYEVMERVRRRYDVRIETRFPDRQAVERLERESGFFSFRDGVEARVECCRVRKVEPLRRLLDGVDAWITGLRRGQSVTRADVARIERDPQFGIVKVNPLADWTEKQVWEHIRVHDVPYNALHDRGYHSIGCAPCTRPVRPGEDARAGRWWWEEPAQKECGLHTVAARPSAPNWSI